MPAKKKPRTIITPSLNLEEKEKEENHHVINSIDSNNNLVPNNKIIQSSSSNQNTKKNAEFTQKVAKLLSQEPPINSIPTTTTTTTANSLPLQSIHNQASIIGSFNASEDPSIQIASLVDQKVKILDEKLKLYQSQITQLRNELETKNQIVDEFRQFQQSEIHNTVEKFKSIAETKFAANAKLIKIQGDELQENRKKIKELNEKISRIYSGEEEKNRVKLETDYEELVKLNEQLKSSLDSQRKKRKEAERELGRANLVAQEAVKSQLKEANDEVETLKKMLEAETTNSKGLINQINQLRSSNNNNSTGTTNSQRNNQNNNNSNNTLHEKVIEDLKTRASIIGDFTGFEILNSSADSKGSIYDCIVTDIVQRGLALNFKLQFHSDDTCSYFPSLNQERDLSTINLLPDFLREFVRFQKEALGHVFWKLFQAFNLSDDSP